MKTPYSTIYNAESDTLLITFGCSWTYGVGAGWQAEQDRIAYTNLAWNTDLCYQLGWRGQLCNKLGFKNLNFSSGGSSNQKQFRLATEFFSTSHWQKIRDKYQKIKVLWGITSTARNEIYDLKENMLQSFSYTEQSDIGKFFLMHSYNHDYDVEVLRCNMRHWNQFLQAQQVDIYWFDTFNTHDYVKYNRGHTISRKKYETIAGSDWPDYQIFCFDLSLVDKKILEELYDRQLIDDIDIENFCTVDNLLDAEDSHRDLMSMLCKNRGFEISSDPYHTSGWRIDCDRVDFLVKQGLLNPYSHHPTRTAHTIISDYFESKCVNL